MTRSKPKRLPNCSMPISRNRGWIRSSNRTTINNLDELVPRLISDKRVQSFDMDPELFAERDQPRPRHTYVLLDKPMPESGVGITRDGVPRLAGVLAIYGRQTDRPERLELTIDKGPAFEAAVTALKQIAGDALGEVAEEKVIGTVSPTELALNWRWHPPRDTPADLRRKLADDERRAAIVERWPTLKQPVLDGKSPKEAASDADLRIPLMASVLILEQGTNSDRDAESITELRRDLNLPQPEPIDPAGQPINGLPLVRVPRLKMEAVSDEDLSILYRRAILVGAQVAAVETCTRSRSSSIDCRANSTYGRVSAADRRRTRSATGARVDSRGASAYSGQRRFDRHLGFGRAGAAHHERQRGRGERAVGAHRA